MTLGVVQLGAVRYNVVQTSAIADYGHTNHDEGTIYLNSRYPVPVRITTLLHEVGHVIMEIRGRLFRETYDKMTKEEVEEAVVELLGLGFADALDNINSIITELANGA